PHAWLHPHEPPVPSLHHDPPHLSPLPSRAQPPMAQAQDGTDGDAEA
ncbi:hypothetical protein A2U01_0087068, partial [Trifolium medium]|nr:hypothetical protein [Trifolium medium]